MTVREIANNPFPARVEKAKNALDAAANKLRQHRLANTSSGYLKQGVDGEKFRRDEELFGADFVAAKEELNSALIAYNADIKARQNGRGGLVQQGDLFTGVRR